MMLVISHMTSNRLIAWSGKIAVSVAVVAALLTLLAGEPVEAQVLFNTLTQNGEQLRQVNSNGSNNIPLQIGNLPQGANPALSNNGRFLSVRSSDPNRPNQFSTNVYVFDSANGQLRKITDFQDSTDPQTGNTFNHSPRYTAFSPDGSMIAVSNFLNVQTNNQGSSTTAFTSVYRVSDGSLLDGPAINGSASTQSTLGVGIGWSSATNRVAVPTIAPNGATAIFSGNSLLSIPVRQETFPQVGIFGNGNFVEDDSFPTYSPNGQALAYFRSRDILTIGGPSPSQLSLRITSPAGDRSIFDFSPGFQPTGISWSPNGSQLAIGLGQQIANGGIRFNLADPATSEIAIINTDGSGIHQLVAAPAFSPAWSSLQQNVQAGDFDNDSDVDGNDFLFWQRGLSPNPGSPADLTTWQNNYGNSSQTLTTVPATGAVPEPSAWGLMLLAATIGLCQRRVLDGRNFLTPNALSL